MFTRFFIDRPIFAAVLSILITLVGSIAVFRLPIAQYPQIAPPTVQVDCNYPGANATVVAQTVAAPIEQQVNGVEDMLYMSSQCTNDGSYTLTVTFKLGVDLNVAQVLVQNRVNLALPQLPDVVKQTGVTTKKRSPDILIVCTLNSPDRRYDQLYLSNYALTRVRDELSRLPGISEVLLFGQRDYSMRIWVEPDRMAVRNITANDVVSALRQQNLQVATGQVGQPPTNDTPATQLVVSTQGRLSEPEEFGNVIVKHGPDGRMVRIRDIARVQLGSRSEDINNRFDQKPTVGLAVFQLPEANALETADAVKEKMTELSADFPDGVAWDVTYDTTPFIRESIIEVFKALRDAILLVAIVVLVFLQSWRSALIPLIAVPVAIIGTFAAMYVVGFSLNNLTLFGLVLAIGIVVDDAIVVVEAVEHHIEHGLSSRDAALVAMQEVSGPVIAVGLVLSAVFIPCAFMSGIVGQFFRQFALTIAISTLISALNSLTLSPALAALLLRPRTPGKSDAVVQVILVLAGGCMGYLLFDRLAEGILNQLGWHLPALAITAGCVTLGLLIGLGLGRLFEPIFDATRTGYTRIVGVLTRGSVPVLVVYGGLLFLTWWGLGQLPTGFIPAQDKGYLLASIQMPDAASAWRTRQAIAKIEKIVLSTPGVHHANSVAGNSFLLSAYGSNFGSMFIILDSFEERQSPSLNSNAILDVLRNRLAAEVPEATIAIFGPPPVNGLGRAGGFKLMIQDRGGLDATAPQAVEDSLSDPTKQPLTTSAPKKKEGLARLQDETENMVTKLKGMRWDKDGQRWVIPSAENPVAGGKAGIGSSFTVFSAKSPQLFVDVDRKACLTQGVELSEVFATLQVFLGSRYVNDFNRFGRTWQVVVQADARYRVNEEDAKKLKVRNKRGDMVPLGAVTNIVAINGPQVLTRYNMYPAAAINGTSADGVSSGETIELTRQLANLELPANMSTEWTEIFYLEQISGSTGLIIFGFSLVAVFLVLAAQYESWSLPLAVILVVPMCVLSSIIGVWLANHDINIFTQVGFVVLIGLACKNAILIVEFAKVRRDEGVSARQAALEACKLRLRPILMTSFAFIFGVVPLMLAHGAGAEMRQTLGTAVFSGMLGVTIFGIFLTPVFFVVVDWVSHRAVFRSETMQIVSMVLYEILTLGLVTLVSLLIRKVKNRPDSSR